MGFSFKASAEERDFQTLSIHLPLYLKHRGRLIGVPAFDWGRGHEDWLQVHVNSNLLNGTVTTYQVRYAVLVQVNCNKCSKEKYQHNITGIVAAQQNKI